ncbi:cation/H(+) antiporter 15 isoform X2 [Beta vulgaris subsp. vulgaris]|nr:cation/H(+) antiporter 15 isoform X2 [Beta vulgaris subsp. vulgaris]
MDVSLMFKPEKIAISIGISLFIFTLIIPMIITIAIMNQVDIESELRKSLPLLVGSQSLVAFPAIACLLAELKIFNTEVGRLAVSTSMFYDLLALSTCAFGFAYLETREEGFFISIAAILSILGFIAGVVVVVRFFLLRLLVSPVTETSTISPGRHHVNELHLIIILVVLFISTLLSEIVGQHYYLGPMVLGLAIPDSSPLGAAVVSKLDTFVSGLLYPTFLAISGLKTDIFSVSLQQSWQTAIIVTAGVLVKFAAVMIPAMQGNIPFQEAFVLALVMNVRGVNELIIYNLVLEDKKISGQDFTLLVVSSILVTAIMTPFVKLLYDPSRAFAPMRKMTIQHHKKDGELKMVVCIHQHDNVPTLVNVLEASGASEESPISVIVVILVEVVGKSAPMLLAYRPQRTLEPSNSCNNHISNAFQQYERQNVGKASVQVYKNMSHFDAMHDDVRRIAAEKRANLVILPFHKQWAIDGTVGAINRSIQEMNLKLLEWVPCSLGILIDRGPSNGSLSILHSKSAYRVAVLFIGGADDVESLAYGARMVRHERVVVTVIRFILVGRDNSRERKHESEIIDDYRKSNSGNERLIYREELVKDGVGLAESIRNMDNIYDLILVGRTHQHSPLLFGLHQWSECPELGVIGDLLASSDAGTTASVLVVQQQKMTGKTNASIGQLTNSRDMFVQDGLSPDRLSGHHNPSVSISILDRENGR